MLNIFEATLLFVSVVLSDAIINSSVVDAGPGDSDSASQA